MLRPVPNSDPPAAYSLKAEAEAITSGAAAGTAMLWQGGGESNAGSFSFRRGELRLRAGGA